MRSRHESLLFLVISLGSCSAHFHENFGLGDAAAGFFALTGQGPPQPVQPPVQPQPPPQVFQPPPPPPPQFFQQVPAQPIVFPTPPPNFQINTQPQFFPQVPAQPIVFPTPPPNFQINAQPQQTLPQVPAQPIVFPTPPPNFQINTQPLPTAAPSTGLFNCQPGNILFYVLGAMIQGRGTCSTFKSFLVILPNVP